MKIILSLILIISLAFGAPAVTNLTLKATSFSNWVYNVKTIEIQFNQGQAFDNLQVANYLTGNPSHKVGYYKGWGTIHLDLIYNQLSRAVFTGVARTNSAQIDFDFYYQTIKVIIPFAVEDNYYMEFTLFHRQVSAQPGTYIGVLNFFYKEKSGAPAVMVFPVRARLNYFDLAVKPEPAVMWVTPK